MNDGATPSVITEGMKKLNPFKSKSRREKDDEDEGDEIDETTVAGGGHTALDTVHHDLRVSDALKSFLAKKKIVKEGDAQALDALLDKPVVSPPSHVLDRSHPLPEYFISSSHNTYLKAHQLYGKSEAAAYQQVLKAGARCVEIDAWDNPDNRDEPKVTHGWTLTGNIKFREVCEVVRDVVDYEATLPHVQGFGPSPILISLENHCDPRGQLRLMEIMREVWGHRLLSSSIREKGHNEQIDPINEPHVSLSDLGAKIAVIVEYHIPGEPDDSSSSSDNSEDEEDRQAHDAYKAQKKSTPATIIIPELAELGVYAQSVKPPDNSWYAQGQLTNGPHHHLINVSESGLGPHLEANSSAIAKHNAHHLMRVYPKGTRISSRNLSPIPFWSVGAQICALNYQRFGASLQLNEALFAGTAGYVLKPAGLRAGGERTKHFKRRKLKLHVAGATEIPLPKDREVDSLKPYVTCTLVHANKDATGEVKKKEKTGVYKPHRISFLHRDASPPKNDPLWDEELEWMYEDDELVFLRIFIKSDDSFSSNPILALAAVRLLYVGEKGWRFVRMLDLKGRETGCTLLVRFEIVDA
ncbi:PLC-like phosphodiesterase [Podospora fimiseda]|uniref:Phosphoinositide phospholipase C n=1 Tax=Podospora fimiseda TaxID=252190 RepID=A0AAN7BGG5_9PEZI|nr:PLC-like phosphodiesterase [Podospora fimiseda]